MKLRHTTALALGLVSELPNEREGCAGCVGFDEGNLPVNGATVTVETIHQGASGPSRMIFV